jgi:hypothetical protein
LRRSRRYGRARARPWFALAFARLGVLLAALALLSQSLAVAAHPAGPPRDAAAAATELRALLGPAVVICAQQDDSGAPQPPQHGCDQCPLCRLAASALAFDVPAPADPVVLPLAVESELARPQPPPLRAPEPPPAPLPRGPPSPT